MLLVGLLIATGCKRNGNKADAQQPAEVPNTPTMRLYLLSTIAGALEPCGCVKDMLGGVDHAAALVKGDAPASLVLGAGPLFFGSPQLSPEKKAQDQWKAESIAAAMADVGLRAWSPGNNDFALGAQELSRLAQTSQARIVAGNLSASGVTAEPTMITEVAGVRVGIAGVSVPKHQGTLPAGVTVTDPAKALLKAEQQLTEKGAQVKVALVTMQRGAALRMAETIAGFQVMVVGKPSSLGEANDAPTPPVKVNDTLVVQGPNHLQGLAVVDLFVRDGSFVFADASGIEQQERLASLKRRATELEQRISDWKAGGSVSAKDLGAREKDLSRIQDELASLGQVTVPAKGSFLRYDLNEVREKAGSDPQVAARMLAYYKRVNDHNKQAFSDKKPEPAAKGEAHFVGGAACIECHEEAQEFWLKTGHAKAYETLEVEHKEFNLDCVGCHVTGYEQPGGSTVTFVDSPNLKDVQCEECHNAGSTHVKTEDTDDILLTPSRDLCKKCHHPPHVPSTWDVEEAWKHVIGPGHGE